MRLDFTAGLLLGISLGAVLATTACMINHSRSERALRWLWRRLLGREAR